MAERRSVSLLECAIAASAVVVPVLLGVIALVAFVRPADPDGLWRQARSDRYVSVRHVAALQTFERAVVHRGSTAPSLVTPRAVLDGLPACRREWGGDTGALHALRELVVGHDDAPAAARIAAQINELDAALLRFSLRANRRVEHRACRHRGRRGRGPAHDGLLEGLQRGNMADADVAIAAPLAPEAVGVGRANERDQRDDAEQDRNDDRARRDRALEQRDRAPLSHGDLATARRR